MTKNSACQWAKACSGSQAVLERSPHEAGRSWEGPSAVKGFSCLRRKSGARHHSLVK